MHISMGFETPESVVEDQWAWYRKAKGNDEDDDDDDEEIEEESK
jgi:hypothetical protein